MNQETIEIESSTVAELYSSLGFKLPPNIVRFAINNRFVPGDTALHDGDQVAFIPPVAGG